MKKVPATPKARRQAALQNISLEGIHGSGEYGAVRCADLGGLAKPRKATPVAVRAAAYYGIDIRGIPAPTVRKADVLQAVGERHAGGPSREALNTAIAKALAETAPYTLHTELDADGFIAAYNALKAEAAQKGYGRLTVSDMLCYTVSRVLAENPALNEGEGVHIAFAVDTGNGLIAPVIRDTQALRLRELIEQRTLLIEAARQKSLTNDALAGGSFTISNLGMTPVTYFTPILNYPQRAILGVGRAEEKAVARAGGIAAAWRIYFSLTIDHFKADGMDGARFFEGLKSLLAEPAGFYSL